MPKTIHKAAMAAHSISAAGHNGYNARDAAALTRLAARWRANKQKPMLISGETFMVTPRSMQIYLYRARSYVRDNLNNYPADLITLTEMMTFKLVKGDVIIYVAPRNRLSVIADTTVSALGKATGHDYNAKQLFVHWITKPHDAGEYLDIPGDYSPDDFTWFADQAREYRGIIHIVQDAQNLRVIWDSERVGGSDESPW